MKYKKIDPPSLDSLYRTGTSKGTAVFYEKEGLEFTGPGWYSDGVMSVEISKAGKLDKPKKKQESAIGKEDKFEHHSVFQYYGNQFFGVWYYQK
ncbi:MAG: hypothetical protein DWQ19_09040 [Crenarchaeota archaeon]|nr:MAG: hypothetical protein DWQ19_09040 [Thermoproteota archaeon]